LASPYAIVESVACSADGRMLVWAVNVDGGSRLRGRDLVSGADLTMPAVPGGQVSELALTPDGQSLMFTKGSLSRSGGMPSADLWLYDVVSGQATQLTNEPGFEGMAFWSPSSSE